MKKRPLKALKKSKSKVTFTPSRDGKTIVILVEGAVKQVAPIPTSNLEDAVRFVPGVLRSACKAIAVAKKRQAARRR